MSSDLTRRINVGPRSYVVGAHTERELFRGVGLSSIGSRFFARLVQGRSLGNTFWTPLWRRVSRGEFADRRPAKRRRAKRKLQTTITKKNRFHRAPELPPPPHEEERADADLRAKG